MAYPAENTQEGGTAGATITNANSGGASGNAFDTAAISGTPVFDNTVGNVKGTMGIKFSVGAALAALYVGWTSTTLTTAPLTVFGRCYYWSSIIPGSSIRLVQFMNGATTLGYLGIASGTGKPTWFNSANTAATVPATVTQLTLSTLCRIEWQFTVATTTTGSANARWFLGDSTTQQGTDSTATAQNFGTLGVNTVRFGNTGANFTINSSFWAGDLQLNTTAFPGPQASGAVILPRRTLLGVGV